MGGDVEGAQGKTVPAVDTGSGKEVFDPGISWTVMIGPAAWGIGGAALLVAAPVVVVRRRRKAG
ncbi:hypothetical protein [Actinocorallia sp. A-T 12471]|uniref:hypothetical protein n=1 Tax=Actinocorallia sp. A-T 12471 TaxID=3089813 RepID=UPI0029CE3C67|nr:hypothetical protein [Actinocorallia sp. A-T 12471]MDX6743575.1 hypothetical protein [Actinocorallia sp. A-T 12471]